jgi:hypothetical protein
MTKRFTLPPPTAHLCQQCGWEHPPDQPHNAQTFFYKVKFIMTHRRLPTWKDAVSHCDEETRLAWEVHLRERGLWTE